MVQIIPAGRRSIQREQLGAAAGQGLTKLFNSYQMNKSLNSAMNDPQYKKGTPYERADILQRAMQGHGDEGRQFLQDRMQAEQLYAQERQQEKQQEEVETIARLEAGEELTPKEIRKLSPKTQLDYLKYKKQKELGKKQRVGIENALKNANVPDEISERYGELYESATEGGKTEILKGMNDLIRRGKLGEFANQKGSEEAKPSISQSQGEQDKYQFPPLKKNEGLLPSEEFKLEADREKHNLPIYEAANNLLSGLEGEYRDIQRLQQLEDRGNLPIGVEKWNVNWETGEPRALALLSPDAQLYQKTIANMLGKAKDYFPGRVTNFDLENFKRRFPTLANSPEGRRLISKQLELANRIAYLKEETLKDAFEHYGSGADPMQVRKIANDNYKRLKVDLEKSLKNLDGLLDDEYQKNLNQSSQQGPSQESSGQRSLEDILG